MMDLVIKNATVVDGLGGAPARRDVGVEGGRIVPPDGSARRSIDADGLVLCPGFIDVHTHYDAQVSWDPDVTPSSQHGVTTIVAGNCGFGLAPLNAPRDAAWLMHMMARVEGMPLEALSAGVSWDSIGFDEWLSRLEGNLTVNAGVLAGHSTIRRFVMGERAAESIATDEDRAAMASLLRAMLDEGALGLSTSKTWTHNDGDGRPVPSRAADHDEMVMLASVLREHPGTTLEIAPQTGAFSEAALDTMIAMSAAAQRPMIWNLYQPSPSNPDLWQSQLAASDRAAAAEAELVALLMTQPMEVRMSFVSGFAVDAIPGWGDVLRLPVDERIAALENPATREKLRHAAETAEIPPTSLANVIHRWPSLTVTEVFCPDNERWLGRTIGDISAERGTDVFDTVLDLVVADGLRTGLHPALRDDEPEAWQLRRDLWYDDRTLVGGSDAGAHLDVMCMANFPTKWLGRLRRQPELGSMQQAVREITAVPAAVFGFRDRGRIAPGYRADLVLLDPERVDAGPLQLVDDLPGGALRLTSAALGVQAVFVNGVQTQEGGRATGKKPGAVIRSGADTEGGLRRRAPRVA